MVVNCRLKRWLISLALLLGVVTGRAQERENAPFRILFRMGDSTIDPTYRENGEVLEQISEALHLDRLASIEQLEVTAYTSPEGETAHNHQLSAERAASLKRYILSTTYGISPGMIDKVGVGVDWLTLRERIADDHTLPRRKELLAVMDAHLPVETMQESQQLKSALMDIGEASWNSLYTRHFPAMRNAGYVVVKVPCDLATSPTPPLFLTFDRLDPHVDRTETPIEAQSEELLHEDQSEKRPFIAVKTNLLFDLMTLINAEVEIPIGNSWSIAAEWIFPWWRWDNGREDSKRNRFQLHCGTLEGRRWFGDRTGKELLTGWYGGFYVGGGYYDFEHDRKGVQGEFFIAAGLSGGYAHTINRSKTLRMEYGLSIGFLKTNYRRYEAYYGIDNHWHPVRTSRGTYRWLGPTKVEVSLVWMLNRNTNKEARR